jgi:hypothetical protein
MELLFGNGGQDASLHTDHRADKRVDQHEQRELSKVLTNPEPDVRWLFAQRRPRVPVLINRC